MNANTINNQLWFFISLTPRLQAGKIFYVIQTLVCKSYNNVSTKVCVTKCQSISKRLFIRIDYLNMPKRRLCNLLCDS